MNAPFVRQARAEDLPQLGDIEASGAETFAAAGRPLEDGAERAQPDAWRHALHAGTLWVVEDAAAGLIGFLAAEVADDGLYIEEVDVIMEYQRRGHGRRLMERAIGWARAEGLAAVTLTTFRDIAWNAPFYASLGFAEIPPGQRSARLSAILADEAQRGFDPLRRCAMRLSLRD